MASVIIDVPGIGLTEFPDNATAEDYFKKNPSQESFSEDMVDAPDATTSGTASLPEGFELSDYAKSAFSKAENLPYASVQRGRANTEANQILDQEIKLWGLKHPKQSPVKPPLSPEGAIAEEADVKKYIDDILQAGNAKRLLENINTSKEDVDTGPWAGRIFDAAVPQFDDGGKNLPPDYIDSLISSIAPEKTGNMRKLAANIQAYTDYAQSKGGKALTKPEKDPLFSQIGTPYDDDPLFQDIQSQAMGNVDQYTTQKISALKNMGFDENALRNLVQENAQNPSDPSIPLPVNAAPIEKLLGIGGQPQDATTTQLKPIDKDTATQIFQQAGGDPNKARELAKQAGYAL